MTLHYLGVLHLRGRLQADHGNRPPYLSLGSVSWEYLSSRRLWSLEGRSSLLTHTRYAPSMAFVSIFSIPLAFRFFFGPRFGQGLWHVTPHDDTRHAATTICKLPPLESDQWNVSLITFVLPFDDATGFGWLVPDVSDSVVRLVAEQGISARAP